jgi:integrase
MTARTRRGNNEGSISYHAASGRWYGRVLTGYHNGKPVRKTVYGETREAVQDELRKLLNARADHLPIPTDERATLAQYLRHWHAFVVTPRVRPTTRRNYGIYVEQHLVPTLGHLRLTALAVEHLEQWMRAQRSTGVSVAVIRHARAVLRIALNDAIKRGRLARNVAVLVDPPTRQKSDRARTITFLDEEQARTLVAAARGQRLEALVLAGLGLGLRMGEACGLKWEDLDVDARTLRIERALQAHEDLDADPTTGRPRQRLELVDVKSEASVRTIPLPDALVEAFVRHRARQKRERLKAAPVWTDSGLIFTTRTGGPLHPRNVLRDFQRLLERARLPRATFHDLRHSAATLLLAQGVHERVIMQTLGHSDIRLTLGRYSHVLKRVQREAADTMNSLLGG